MAEIITRKKNQIRPRSDRIRFNNDALIAMSTDGLNRTLLPDSFPLNRIIEALIIKVNIVQVYTNIDTNSEVNILFTLSFNSDSGVYIFENLPAAMGTGGADTINEMFGTAPGQFLLQAPTQYLGFTVGAEPSQLIQNIFTGLSPQGDLVINWDNGVSGALTGGDPGNWMEIDVYSYLLNVSLP
jgi:hypothetical protein